MKTIAYVFGKVGVDWSPNLRQELLLGVPVSLVDPSLAPRDRLPRGLAAVAIGVPAVLGVAKRFFCVG
jgi:hypothetical protein